MTDVDVSGTIVCILSFPTVELKREPDKVRWCFKCRKHLPHDWVLRGPETPAPDDTAAWDAFLESTAAYYEPSWGRQCSGCGKDCTRMWG